MGEYLINGQDLSEIDSDHRHRSIRMVRKMAFLFDTSVIENVRYGRNDEKEAMQKNQLTLWVYGPG